MMLSRELEYLSATDFRSAPGDALMQVAMGKVYIITKNGRPYAVLSPLPGEQLTIKIGPKGDTSYER